MNPETIPFEIVFSSSLNLPTHLAEYILRTESKTISSNEDFSPTSTYSLLVLNDKVEGMYSGVIFRSESNFDAIAYYDHTINNISDILDAAETLKFIFNKPGVLTHQHIKSLLKVGILIYKGRNDSTKGASYDLSLDGEHLLSGVSFKNDNRVAVDPLDFIVVGAKESANMPKNITGTFDLKVSMFCRGIILSNGPQVDPGYRGRLFCLLHNSSSSTFEMLEGRTFSTIVFHALSCSSEKPYTGNYQHAPNLRDYISTYATNSTFRTFEQIKTLLQNTETNISDILTVKTDIATIKSSAADLDNKLNTAKETKTMVIAAMFSIISFVIAIFLAWNSWEVYSKIGKFEEKFNSLEVEYKSLQDKIQNLYKIKSSTDDATPAPSSSTNPTTLQPKDNSPSN